MEIHLRKIQKHFNSKYTDYDVCCDKVVPRNEEVQQTLVQTIPFGRTFNARMLDLGMGTGLTTWHVLNKFPNSRIDGIDFSSEMLKQAERRMGLFNSKVNLIKADFTEYDLKGNYNVIFSAATIHNLPDEQKRRLFSKICKHLSEGGCFINADFIKFKSGHLTKRVADFYEKFLKEKLAGRELEHWLRHFKKEDLPITMEGQFAWLKEAGFSDMECRWMYQNFAIVYAIK